MFSTPGGYHEYTRGVQYTRDYREYTGEYQDVGGYHEYTGGCSLHWRDTMSTPGTNEKRPWLNFEDFCSRTFCNYAVYTLAFRTSDSLLKFLHQVAKTQTLMYFLFHL